MQDMETIKNINNDIRAIMMPMYNELVELRNKLSSLSSGPEYRSTKVKFDDLHKQYNLFGETNSKIVKFTSKDQVKSELLRITNERAKLYKEFVNLKQQYALAKSKGASTAQLNQIVNKAREITPIINCYDKLIAVFNKSLGRTINSKITSAPRTSSNNAKDERIVKRENENSQRKSKEPKALAEYLDNPDIKTIYTYGLKIQKLKDELYKHSQGSPKADFLNKLIYDLCEQREKLVTDILGPEAISKIAIIESMEDAAFSKANVVSIKPYTITGEQYSRELNDLISILSDLKFNELDSKVYQEFRKGEVQKAKKQGIPYVDTENQSYKKIYEVTVRKYKNLLNSVIGNDKGLASMKDDLLASLTAFNLSGGYGAFKKKHKNGKIGGSAISREVYTDGTNKIKELISSLDTYATKYIAKKGGKITIVDSEKTRGQMISEVNKEYAKLFEQIESRRKKSVETRA